jgi:DNA-binding SARP family transcriptional activator/WD40 repeat protein
LRAAPDDVVLRNTQIGRYGRRMQFRVLGPLEVDAGDGPVPLGGPKQRTVLAHLLVRANEVVPADTLIDHVWGEAPPSQARNTLQTYVSSLRKSLGADVLLGRDPGYVLVLDPIEVDATRFDALVREAQRTIAVDPRIAIDTLDDALALWRGPALADVAEGSLFAEAARLDELRLEAQEKRIDALLAIGDTTRAIGELEPLVGRHPLREGLWEQLLLALYRDGRQGEALDAFQRAREMLADELGVDPSTELTRLHGQILAHDAALELRGEPLRGYRLLEQTGTSPVGTRFRAIQPRMERDVEIEVVREEVAGSESFVERFEREARAVASLEHPHILPLYDYWREPGRAYVVTRYVRGPTLDAHLERERPTVETALTILGQVAAALAFAHRDGVVHGRLDVSCVRLDPDGNVYLGGFTVGSGRVPSVDDDLNALRSIAGAMLGSAAPAGVQHLLEREPFPDARTFSDALSDALGGPARGHAPEPSANPYRGLQPFGEQDREVFFGRAAATRDLADAFRSSRFVAVVGPSGCGKSSLVQAGLVPALRSAHTADARVFVTSFTPGRHPFEQLASALEAVALRNVQRGDDLLERTSRGLADFVERGVPGNARVVLVIDQLEELFTVTVTEAERAAFLESVRVASVDPGGRLSVVATLRADFYDRPLAYARFGELLAAHTFALAPLQPDELEHAIARPAARAGAHVEPELIAEIVADAAHQPGSLPLVQFALTELFEGRTEEGMTRAAYLALGGIVGTVATKADESFERADHDERRAIKQLLLRLVALGEGRPDTRLRVARSAFDPFDLSPEVVDRVITTMGRLRLVTFDRDATTREPTVEIAHEALLDAWPRLRGWIDEARDDLRAERRIEQSARDWTANDQEASFLLRGARLEQAAAWITRTDLSPPRSVRRYVTASLAQRDREADEIARQRDREAAVERRSARRLRALVAVFAAAALVAGSLTLIATDQRRRASKASSLAATRELAAASAANLDTDPELAVLLGIEAVERSLAEDDEALPQAEEALHDAIAASRIIRVIPGLGGQVVADGKVLAAARSDHAGQVSIVDLAGHPIRTIDTHDGQIRDLALGGGGALLLTFGRDGWLRAWDVDSGSERWHLRRTKDEVGDVPFRVSVDASGTVAAAAWPAAGRILVIDARSGRVRRTLRCDPGFCQAAVSSEGDQIAVAYGLDHGVEQGRIGPTAEGGRSISFQAPVYAGINGGLSWSADGELLSGSAFVWDTSTGDLVHTVKHGFMAETSTWSPDGRLVTGAAGTARLWDASKTELDLIETISPLGGTDAITDVAAAPDGDHLITASQDALSVWDIRPLGMVESGGLELPTEYAAGVMDSADGAFEVKVDEIGTRTNIFGWTPGEQRKLEVVSPLVAGTAIDVNPVDGSLLVVDGSAMLRRVDGRNVDRLPISATDAVWTADGRHVVVSSVDGSVALEDTNGNVAWDVDTGLKPHLLKVRNDGHIAVAGKDVVSGANRVLVLDVTTGDAVATVPISARIADFELDPNGRWLVISGNEQAPLQLWDVATARLVATFPDERSEYRGFSLSPDGTTLAVMGDDQAVRLYDTGSRQLRMTLPPPSDLYGDLAAREGGDLRCHARGLAFSADGSLLAAQGCGGVRVFALDVDELLAIAHEHVTRSLSDDECLTYLHRACSA